MKLGARSSGWMITVVLLVGGHVQAQEESDDVQRLQAYRAEMRASADPVAVAVKMTRDRIHVQEGMQVLFKNWLDPRSRAALAELSAQGPHAARCLVTTAGKAADLVRRIDAKHAYEKIMKGMTTPKEKMAAVRAAFAANPDWLSDTERSNEDYYITLFLIDTARDAGKGESVDLLLRSGLITRQDGEAFADALVAHFKREGRIKVLGNPYGDSRRIFPAVASKNPEMVKIVHQWLNETENEQEMSTLVRVIVDLPAAQDRLLKLFNDRRPFVVKEALGWASFKYADAATLQGVRGVAERRRADGAEERELSYYAAVIRGIEREIAERKKNPQ